MAVLKGSSQRQLRHLLSRALKDRQIKELLIEAEIAEGEPIDGFKTHHKTGRQFLHITTVLK